MVDIALNWDPERWRADWVLNDDGVLDDSRDLETAVILSIFTDRTALPDDEPPDGGHIRGWWADTFFVYPLGSRFWLMGREKQLETVRRRVEEYAREALAWLITEGVARKIDVSAVWIRKGWLELTIELHSPAGARRVWRYPLPWAQLAGQ